MDWVYTDRVKDHFQHPRNILEDEEGYGEDGRGYVGNPKCGDMMLMAIKVDRATETITDCKWKTYGCASAVASTSMLSEMVRGKTLAAAYQIKPDEIMRELGGLPDHKIHCSVLGDKALRSAIDDYYKRSGQQAKIQANDVIICNCLQVSEKDIKRAVFEGVRTWEQLQDRTKIGTSCGGCVTEAKVLLDETIEDLEQGRLQF